MLALALCGVATAHAQDGSPTTFPGQQGPATRQPVAAQPAAASPPAQRQPAQPPPLPRAMGPREPRLEAREHTCETLFGGDEAAGLEPNEECFRDPEVRWRWQLAFVTGPTRTGDWDDALAARGYGPSDVLFGGETSLLRTLGSYVALGARTGVRDLRWVHYERPAATVFAWDLLLTTELRFALGRRELFSAGLDAGVGLGLAFSRVNDGRATDLGWRLQGNLALALRIVGPGSALLKLGYDHFPVTIGESLDAHFGGFRVTLGVEVRE